MTRPPRLPNRHADIPCCLSETVAPMSRAEYYREYRARRKAAGGGPLRRSVEPIEPVVVEDPALPGAPAFAVEQWASERLIVPPGHRLAGQPMVLPSYFVEFLEDALAEGIREAGCFVARKNSKSACVAVLILAHLADDGPLRRRGWRCGLASLSRDKAIELWQQCADIAESSSLEGVTFGKVPRVIRSQWGEAAVLSADRGAGHASGFDLAVADELGLFPEKGRDLVAGLLSSTSARDGRLLAISVIGDSPLSRELIDRKADPAVAVHVHQADPDAALDDEIAWHAANPALASGIKSLSYMRDMARRASANPSEQAAFRAFDLNQPGEPTRELIVPTDRWIICANKNQPDRIGRCFVGFDLGGSVSMTAAAAYWPESGRLDCWGAFGEKPDLLLRGEADGVGDRYGRMMGRGELRTFPGRVTPVSEFLTWIGEELLADEVITLAAADRHRVAEAIDALHEAGCLWPMEWRAQGRGKDGSADVRAFQRAVESGSLRPGRSLLLESAIRESVIHYDPNGNPGLDKRRHRGRIDPLSAAILAVGIGSRSTIQTTNFLGITHES